MSSDLAVSDIEILCAADQVLSVIQHEVQKFGTEKLAAMMKDEGCRGEKEMSADMLRKKLNTKNHSKQLNETEIFFILFKLPSRSRKAIVHAIGMEVNLVVYELPETGAIIGDHALYESMLIPGIEWGNFNKALRDAEMKDSPVTVADIPPVKRAFGKLAQACLQHIGRLKFTAEAA